MFKIPLNENHTFSNLAYVEKFHTFHHSKERGLIMPSELDPNYDEFNEEAVPEYQEDPLPDIETPPVIVSHGDCIMAEGRILRESFRQWKDQGDTVRPGIAVYRDPESGLLCAYPKQPTEEVVQHLPCGVLASQWDWSEHTTEKLYRFVVEGPVDRNVIQPKYKSSPDSQSGWMVEQLESLGLVMVNMGGPQRGMVGEAWNNVMDGIFRNSDYGQFQVRDLFTVTDFINDTIAVSDGYTTWDKVKLLRDGDAGWVEIQFPEKTLEWEGSPRNIRELLKFLNVASRVAKERDSLVEGLQRQIADNQKTKEQLERELSTAQAARNNADGEVVALESINKNIRKHCDNLENELGTTRSDLEAEEKAKIKLRDSLKPIWRAENKWLGRLLMRIVRWLGKSPS